MIRKSAVDVDDLSPRLLLASQQSQLKMLFVSQMSSQEVLTTVPLVDDTQRAFTNGKPTGCITRHQIAVAVIVFAFQVGLWHFDSGAAEKIFTITWQKNWI